EDLYSELSKLDYNKRYNYIKDHNLHVTRRTNVPSVLIEAGYITNDKEVLKVGQPSYQNKIAQKVVNAIKNYFKWI
ncbi:MAG: N-acetylmuramoyl-L-alanine amidase family protein, partial [Senegalia sp. (in: firmicutes)]|uniref:N-acetylmuramoyl-L-alanine amidase family protein n=1 Tax=Senegalia sp. (in: firmicutes) TaxID=1924098 RepID=UPI003F967F38